MSSTLERCLSAFNDVAPLNGRLLSMLPLGNSHGQYEIQKVMEEGSLNVHLLCKEIQDRLFTPSVEVVGQTFR